MRAIEGIIIIVIATVLCITVYRVEQLPSDNTCKDMSCPSCKGGYNCDDYNYLEKMRYVWNLY